MEDLYIFPRAFEQVYFLMYSLEAQADEDDVVRIKRAFEAFPWQGGYSAVGFYDHLKHITPRQNRPQIKSIEYHSPGWIDLDLINHVAESVGILVTSVGASLTVVNSTYNRIVKGMQERKLMRIKIEREQLILDREQLRFVEECADSMAHVLGFSSIQEIHRRTGDPYRSLKILLSLFRRVRTLVEFEDKGKAHLPTPVPKNRGR